MSAPMLLPARWPVALDYVTCTPDTILLVLTTTQPDPLCPECGHPARRVHSHYERTVADLPWQGIAVHLRLRSRRFFCDRSECDRSIFTERLPGLVPQYGRRTLRLAETVHLLGAALGGEGGARLAERLGMAISPDALLGQLRARAREASTPRVLGVDDFAFRKGQRYGTILMDLETGDPVDLLPDRRAETLAEWLEQHRGVEILTRDRSGPYKEGARKGAPDAVQVADRWHLLQNLWEALEGALAREHRALQAAARPEATEPVEGTGDAVAPGTAREPVETAPSPRLGPKSRSEPERGVRRARRVAAYEEVHRLYAEGYSIRAIAYKTGKHRQTVRAYLEAKTFPERKPRAPSPSKPGKLAAYEAYLVRRWREGCHNGKQLWRELCEQGFEGSGSTVQARLEEWRKTLPLEERRMSVQMADKTSQTRAPAPRTVVWWLLGSPEKRTEEQVAFLERLKQECPKIEVAQGLALEFLTLTRRREAEKLEGWTKRAVASGIGELKRFCAGLRRDWEAVMAGLTLPWSNGPVEGHVNRLKLVKRQMYGRAGFALLRARVLPLPEAA